MKAVTHGIKMTLTIVAFISQMFPRLLEQEQTKALIYFGIRFLQGTMKNLNLQGFMETPKTSKVGMLQLQELISMATCMFGE